MVHASPVWGLAGKDWRSRPNGPPPLSLLPPPKTKPPSGKKTTGSKARPAELQALEQRLVRLEQLVLLIAQQVGVPHEAIERLPPPAAPEH
jgi:hypothetical protein